ncbi:hypothetical protein X566_19945 [Afipia sp. P52-10]|uniref:DUF5131 family protein n=1 Tax=Afipia sp. P52-10 TaxID=1429916 RepID=UPI0003DF363D|nr:phage Gp37/Gp68 family protein [Afipia sp. P52-10]ETR75052.1 hypothetical protein X566_19945 [Afipia sp. P52-10]
MADNSDIEWTDATWNIVTGCSVVSPGCTNCYAMRLAGTRLRNHPSRAGLTTDTKAGPVWTGDVRFNHAWLAQPLTWSKPRRIFVCAHGDLFHENVPDDWIDKVFAVMALAPQHTFQVLTKRASRMRDYLSGDWAARARFWVENLTLPTLSERAAATQDRLRRYTAPSSPAPLENVWLGVSAERQQEADERIPRLLATPAAVRFLSAEPLLGPIDLTALNLGGVFSPFDALSNGTTYSRLPKGLRFYHSSGHPTLDWVIVGGENGPRPMHPSWVRRLRDQCAQAGRPFFFKQWGSWAPECYTSGIHPDACYDDTGAPRFPGATIGIDGARYATADDAPAPHAFMRNAGKKYAGRLLDGAEHNAMPEAGR